MSGKRLRGPDVLPPRLKRRAVSGGETATTQTQLSAQPSFYPIGSQPAQRSGLQYVELAASNECVVQDMLSGLRHDPSRSDLFIGLALLTKRNAALLRGKDVVQQLIQFFMDPASPTYSLQLVSEMIQHAFPDELPLQLYKFYIDSLLDEFSLSKWLSRDELRTIVSRLRLLSSPPDAMNAAASNEDEEVVHESGSVSISMQSLNLQQQVGAYIMSKINGSPTPTSRLISLLSQGCVLAECRLGAIRFLAGAPNSSTLSGPIAELIGQLCHWIINHADFSLLHGLLSLPIASKSLTPVLSIPRYWQAALSFLLSQDKVTINSQPDIFHAIFSQADLVRSVLPNLCLRYLSDLSSGTRPVLHLQVVLHWASCNPPSSPYVEIPQFPLSLLASADFNNLAVLGLASFLGNARSGVKAADFQLEAVRLLNRRCTEGNTSGDFSAAIQILLAQNTSGTDISFPIHCDTILHILSLSIMHHRLDSMSALSIVECAAARSLAQPISTSCSAENSRSICEAIMQLSIIAEPDLIVQSSLYWKSVTLLVLLSSLCPGSIGAFAYKRIANVCQILNAILTSNWEPVPTIADSAVPERLPLDLSISQPVPDSILADLRHLATACTLSNKIICNDNQFQLVTLLSGLQSPEVLCSWLLPVLNEAVSRWDNVPVIVLAHLLLYLGTESPPFSIKRIRSSCASYVSPEQSHAAASVILQLLRGLSHADAEIRLRARTALQISFQCDANQPFSFLTQSAVVDLGSQLIRSAIQAESCPSAITHYVKFLIDQSRRRASLSEELVRFLYENVLLRPHIARTLLTDHGAESGLYDLIQSVISNQASDNLSEFLLDVLVVVASHGGVPLLLRQEFQRLLRPDKLSARHLDLLLDGSAYDDLHVMAIEISAAEQVQRFARGFGRSTKLLEACRLRLRSLGFAEDGPAGATMEDHEPVASEPFPNVILPNVKLESEAIVPSLLDVQHLSISSPDRIIEKRFDFTMSNLEVVTPHFHPIFHTTKYKNTNKSNSASKSFKDRLLCLWSTGRYEELITAIKDLYAFTET